MTTTVEQGVDGALLIPDNDEGFIRDLCQKIIPGTGSGFSPDTEMPSPVPGIIF